MDIDQWRFLLQTFPLEMDQIMTGEVLNGRRPAADAHILSAIVAAEDVIDPARHTPDPARTPPPMGMEAILEAFKPVVPQLTEYETRKRLERTPITEADLLAVKLAYADAEIQLDRTDTDDQPAWDNAYAAKEAAEKVLRIAAKRPIADVPLVSLGQGEYTRNLMAEDVIDPRGCK